ncbi:hypothetical protein BDV96DRAFT_588344 [Lophiotrema nucula]|uniref:Mitochondrial ribosomal protein L28-domain-containing protein n=1 Tax=Lophiotrema nucula TaxID=690887 RepID=A0A6A5YLQ0_9PLEO|nr:hypothetical protein BDV96DRAFT_588344 [Lophiotrema nucula]
MNLSTFSRPALRPANCSAFRVPSALRQNATPFQKPRIHRAGARAADFSSTAQMMKRKDARNVVDPRITNIRYHLSHPLTPRPLRFSRTRALRHWTIHRAWLLFLRKRRRAQELDLERQYMSMRSACEALRLLDESGNTVSPAEAGGFGPDPGTLGMRGKEVGRLYRQTMSKKGLVGLGLEVGGGGKSWAGGVPIEYARLQTDFPSREGWNHGWTR